MAGGTAADPAAALRGCFAALAGVSEDPAADELALRQQVRHLADNAACRASC